MREVHWEAEGNCVAFRERNSERTCWCFGVHVCVCACVRENVCVREREEKRQLKLVLR